MFLGRTGGTADAVAAGTSAEQEDHVAGSRALAPHGGGGNGPHDSADFHALGGITLRINLTHVRGCQADLVAVAGIAGGGLAADHPLRQFAGDGLGHAGVHIAGTGHAHGLIDIGTAGERVTDGAAEAGGGTAERLDLGRVVMGLVLELEEPFLGLSVHVHVHENTASIVFLALLHVVQLALLTKPAGADGSELHQAAGFVPAAEVRAHLFKEVKGGFQFGLHEGLVHRDLFQDGSEGRMTAVVAPVGVQDTELRLGRIPAFGLEILHHVREIVGVHGEAVSLAEGGVILRSKSGEAGKILQRLHGRLLAERQHGEILLAAFYRVDEIVADLGEGFLGDRVFEHDEPGALDFDLGFRIDQMDTVHGGGGPLVELAGNVFHGNVFLSLEVEAVGDRIRHHLAEHAVAALLQQVVGESEQVVHIEEPEGSQAQGKVFVELGEEAGCLHAELLFFLYKDAPVVHIQKSRCPPTLCGGGGHGNSDNGLKNFVALLLAESLQLFPEGIVLEGKDGYGVQGGILGSVDGHGRDGDTRRHLHNGQEGIQPVQGLGLHRDADDRKGGQGRNDARKVGGTAGAGDDDVESIVPGGADIVGQRSRIAVCAEYFLFVGNAEFFEGGAGRGHDVPIAGAAHDDGYLAHAVKTFSTNGVAKLR